MVDHVRLGESPRRHRLAVATVAAVLLALIPASAAAAPAARPGIASAADSRRVDPATLPPAATAAATTKPRLQPLGPTSTAATDASPTPSAAIAVRAQAPAVGIGGFAGDTLAQQRNAFSSQDIAPPDNGLAVGSAYIVQMLNASAWVYLRNNGAAGPVASWDLNVFFVTSPDRAAGYRFSDPRVVWDPTSSRWFASGVGFNGSYQSKTYVAISDGADPTQGWNIRTVSVNPTRLTDQPRIGVSTDKVVLAWDDYQSSNLQPVGSTVLVMDRATLASGASLSGQTTTITYAAPFASIVPAYVSDAADVWAVYNNGASLDRKVHALRISGPASSAITTDTALTPGSPTSNGTGLEAVQPGTGVKLDAGDDRVEVVAIRSGVVWAAANTACTLGGLTTVCVRMFRVDVSGTPTLTDATIGLSGKYAFFGAPAIDSAGNVTVVFSMSDATTTYPGVYASSAAAGGVAFGAPFAVHAAVNIYNDVGFCGGTICRWGDYSSAQADPCDGAYVWVSGEYAGPAMAPALPTSNWSTWIAPVTVGAAGTPAACGPTVTSITPATGTAGTTVTVTGTGFTGAQHVYFGSAEAAVTPVSDTSFTATAPPATLTGRIHVSVVGPSGASAVTDADLFTYGSRYAPMNPDPVRLVDTRPASGPVGTFTGPLAAGQSFNVQVTGRMGIPSSGVAAAVMTLTVTDTSAPGFLTVYPAGSNMPTASNLNWDGPDTRANLATVMLGAGGAITVYNANGGAPVNVVIDVSGYYLTTLGTEGLLNAVAPSRILETRPDVGAVGGHPFPLGQAQTLDLQVAGTACAPASGAGAVVLNVTATRPTLPGFLTVYPAGSSPPLASSINFAAGQTIADRVIVKLGAAGRVTIYNASGGVDVVVDCNGWFSDGTVATTGLYYVPVAPTRILETRPALGSVGGHSTPIGPGGVFALAIAGTGTVPAGATAAILNVTITDTTAPSFLTVYPQAVTPPLASDVNWPIGTTISNLTVVGLASGGIDLYNLAGTANLVADLNGWYAP